MTKLLLPRNAILNFVDEDMPTWTWQFVGNSYYQSSITPRM